MNWPRITIRVARQFKINRAAPLRYQNWYDFSDRMAEVMQDPFWAPYSEKLQETNMNFIGLNLQNEVGLLITTRKHQIIFLNKTSVEDYMRVPIPWLAVDSFTRALQSDCASEESSPS